MGAYGIFLKVASFFPALVAVSADVSESVSDTPVAIEGGIQLAIQYGWYLILIVAGILLLALVRRRAKKNLTPEAVKQNCISLQKRLEDTLKEDEKEKSGRSGMFSQTKLMKLRSMAEESMWSAARLVEERKDLVFDGVVSSLDEIANLLADCADNAFAEREENEKIVRAALNKTEGVLAQIEAIIKQRKE